MRKGLWRHPDFLKLWGGQTVSLFGSGITMLALPTLAILVLNATPFQMGILGALGRLAFPVLGLFAGVWVDRLFRRPVMIVCDLVRAMALAAVPAAFVLHGLSLWLLYAVAIATGVGTVFFDVAYQSYLPALIDRRALLEGNTKLEISRSVAQVSSPSAAGFLIQLTQPVWAILVDAVSFVVSAISIGAIRKPEPVPAPGTVSGKRDFRHELWEGLQVVVRNSILRRISACTATSNLGSSMGGTVFLIFAYRQLGLTPAFVGTVFALGSFGAILGTLLAAPAARRFRLGPTLVGTIVASGVASFLVPLAAIGFAPAFLLVSTFVVSMMVPLYNINQVSLRQAIVPDRLQGRMNATVRTIVWGTIPIGGFVGGVLGEAIGILPTLIVSAAVMSAAAAWILAEDVRGLREQPIPPLEAQPARS